MGSEQFLCSQSETRGFLVVSQYLDRRYLVLWGFSLFFFCHEQFCSPNWYKHPSWIPEADASSDVFPKYRFSVLHFGLTLQKHLYSFLHVSLQFR